MKKSVYCLVALGAIVSCAKEIEIADPVKEPISENGTEISIKAFVEEGTKTAYADHKTFSWLSGDMIRVQLSDGGDGIGFANFQTADAGASAEFTGTVLDYYRPSTYAVYPQYLNPDVTGETLRVTLPQRFFYNRGNEDKPIDGALAYVGDASAMKNLALVGTLQSDGSYKFQSAQGIVHLTFYNVPDDAGATFMILNSNEEVWGTFAVEDATIKMSNYVSGGSQMSYAVVTPANGKVDLYWPLPVGTLTSGAEFQLCDASQSVIYSVTTKKDIVIERNKITELAPVNALPWKTVGTARYNDSVIFGNGVYVDVTLEQDTESGGYRINNPYAVWIAETGYVPSVAVTAPSPYLSFGKLAEGSVYGGLTVPSADLVSFGTGLQTGVYSGDVPGMLIKSNHTAIRLLNVTSFDRTNTLPDISYSKVLKYKDDGVSPANIQLAPVYYTDTGYLNYWLWMNGNIQIVFPGCEPLDYATGFSLGAETAASTAEQHQFSADFVIGNDLTAGYYAVSADYDEAVAAIVAGNGTAVSSGPGVVNFPANVKGGTYYVAFTTYKGDEPWKTIVEEAYIDPHVAASYGDFVGEWVIANTVWTIEPDEVGVSYKVKADVLGLGGMDLDGRYVDGKFAFMEKSFGDVGGYTGLTLSGEAYSSEDDFFGLNKNYSDPKPIFYVSALDDGTFDIIPNTFTFSEKEYTFNYMELWSLVEGQFSEVSFASLPSAIKPYVPSTARYEDFLGTFTVGTQTWTITEALNGSTYSVSGIPGPAGVVVTALYKDNTFVLMEQDVPGTYTSSYGSVTLILRGRFSDGSSNYYGYPSNNTEPDVLMSVALENGTYPVTAGCWRGYEQYVYSYGFYGILGEDAGSNAGKGLTYTFSTIPAYITKVGSVDPSPVRAAARSGRLESSKEPVYKPKKTPVGKR